MPDISMCKGTDCPLKETCYRYKATPSEFMQAYFTIPPIKNDGTCDYYWKDESKTEKNDRNNL
jgi:hypothetical protein